MRPLVRCRTRSIQISAPLPHGNAVPTTVDTLYSSLYFVCACGALTARASAEAASASIILRFILSPF